MTLNEFRARRQALGASTLIVCPTCGGLGADGCPHVITDYVAPPVSIPISRVGTLPVDAAAPVSIAISSTTGLPVKPRW